MWTSFESPSAAVATHVLSGLPSRSHTLLSRGTIEDEARRVASNT